MRERERAKREPSAVHTPPPPQCCGPRSLHTCARRLWARHVFSFVRVCVYRQSTVRTVVVGAHRAAAAHSSAYGRRGVQTSCTRAGMPHAASRLSRFFTAPAQVSAEGERGRQGRGRGGSSRRGRSRSRKPKQRQRGAAADAAATRATAAPMDHPTITADDRALVSAHRQLLVALAALTVARRAPACTTALIGVRDGRVWRAAGLRGRAGVCVA